ncbi:MAG: FAD-dependent oxidoreductase [Acidimicrobiales bacterium]
MHRADVVVIGAGVMGSATAWWLARDGRHVVVLEQFDQGHARGSSHGATRIFRFAYPDSAYVTMVQAALRLWREVEADGGQTLIERTGAVDHGDPRGVRAIADAMSAAAAPHELLDPDAAHERWPGMRFEGDVVFHADGGRCRADRAVRALQDRAASHGADFHFGVGPARLAVRGDEVVAAAADREWRVPAVVVTAGAWVRGVLDAVGLADRLPRLRVTQEQVQHFRPRPAHDAPERWPSFIHHRQPWHYGLYAPGEGVKVGAHIAGIEIDPDRPVPRDDARELAIVGYVKEWFPGLDPRPVHPATCLYTTTPTEDFIVDRVGPVVIGSPCSGHGFKFAPLIGRMLADLAEGKPGAERFRLPI